MKDEIDRLTTEWFEEIEHTADWAYRVWGEDLKALFIRAAKGLYDLAGDRVTREINLQGIDSENLGGARIESIGRVA